MSSLMSRFSLREEERSCCVFRLRRLAHEEQRGGIREESDAAAYYRPSGGRSGEPDPVNVWAVLRRPLWVFRFRAKPRSTRNLNTPMLQNRIFQPIPYAGQPSLCSGMQSVGHKSP